MTDTTMPDPEALTKALVAELRAERAAQEMTHRELSEKTGNPVRKLERIFTQQSKVFATDLILICAGLGIDVEEIASRARRRLGA